MNDDKLEKYVILVYTIHNISMCIGSIHHNWSNWLSVFFILAGIVDFVLVYSQFKDYVSRATFVAISINICLVLYGCHSESINDIIVPFLGVSVLLALYGIQNLMMISFAAISITIFYHGGIIHTFAIRNTDDIYKYGMGFINVYFIIFVLYFWIVKRNEQSKEMGAIIQELKVAEQGKDDFLANVSHEIRTPVNTVVGMSEIVLRENLDEHLTEEILNIQTSGRQLVSVVSDILDFSELQSGKMKLIEVEYNINSTIMDIISMTKAMSADKNIDIVVDCDGSLPLNLIGDEQKLRRMILNLISNAIKFTCEGGIVVSFEYRHETYGINLIITVKDTGIGIDKKNIERLFTTYNQVDSNRNRQEGGIGLGLAIVRAIVEVMGGVLSVKSELGRGSEFRVVIPQKVEKYEPMVTVSKALINQHLLTYFAVEDFDSVLLREAYSKQIKNIAANLKMQLHMCHNLAELKRRVERDFSSIVLISIKEYFREKEFFEELSHKMKVAVILERLEAKKIQSPDIIQIYKPMYIGTFLKNVSVGNQIDDDRIIAPDAEVLVVDDNIINLNVISGLLEPYKMNVTLSSSGADALEQIDKKQFDIIFMDHMMPEMDGIETLKRIRNKIGLYYKEVPVVALTANSVAGAREMFLEEGFQEFLAKPIELGILERILRTYISPNKIIKQKNVEDAGSVGNYNDRDEKNESNVRKLENQIEGLEDFDIKQGISFCGSFDNLINILKIHCNEGYENYQKIYEFFENKDWKNYQIIVHGLKSSMKSVGANALSEYARLIEKACKSDDVDYIMKNHSVMMKEYDKILKSIYNYFELSDKQDEEQPLDNISEEAMTAILSDFENAAYLFDEELLRKIISKMDGYAYKNNSFNEVINMIDNKINMSDYISAFEALKKWKDKVDRKASVC